MICHDKTVSIPQFSTVNNVYIELLEETILLADDEQGISENVTKFIQFVESMLPSDVLQEVSIFNFLTN